MRGLWKTLACIGENAGTFNNDLGAVCQYVEDPDLIEPLRMTTRPGDPRILFLRKQPTRNILMQVDTFLRSQGLVLLAYELAEVNRLVYETKNQSPTHKNLKAYWSGLGPAGPANRNSDPFMQAVGALAIDGWLRSGFASGAMALSNWFNVTAEQENSLRSVLAPGSPADVAAKDYFADSWPSGSCASIVTPATGWLHLNV